VRLAEELGRRAGLAVYNTQLYEEAVRANRAKSDFLATMSHELRTPLNAITGYTDLLQIGVPDREEQLAHLDRIKASAWHLLSVIEQVLSFSRLDADRETFVREPVDIGEVAHQAASFMRPAASQKLLALEIREPEDAIVIESDRDKVRQILLNLLANALKFTEAGVVTLNLARLDEGVSLRVRDTGIGIDARYTTRIFEPFFQVEAGITRRAGGTGLGLAVTHELVELLGGRIGVQSEPGAGSTFEVVLPARPAD
jgi:signal transduction histidine kinase